MVQEIETRLRVTCVFATEPEPAALPKPREGEQRNGKPRGAKRQKDTAKDIKFLHIKVGRDCFLLLHVIATLIFFEHVKKTGNSDVFEEKGDASTMDSWEHNEER